mgnify:CR=1 FL=1
MISEWIWKLVHGSLKLSEIVILKAGEIDAIQEVKLCPEPERTLVVALSGMVRMAAPFSCLAGAGLAGRSGATSAAIDTVGRRG